MKHETQIRRYAFGPSPLVPPLVVVEAHDANEAFARALTVCDLTQAHCNLAEIADWTTEELHPAQPVTSPLFTEGYFLMMEASKHPRN